MPNTLNTNASLEGKTITVNENNDTITGLKTFDRDPSAPFAVSSGSAVVSNLDADKLDGKEAADFVLQTQLATLDADKLDGQHGAFYQSAANWTNLPSAALTWTSWTPTWGGITLGNGTSSGRYIQIGKLIIYKANLLFGSTTSVSAGISVNYPVTAVSASYLTGDVLYFDSSLGGFYRGLSFLVSNVSQNLYADNGTAGGAYQGVTSAIPFTWAQSDQIWMVGIYDAA